MEVEVLSRVDGVHWDETIRVLSIHGGQEDLPFHKPTAVLKFTVHQCENLGTGWGRIKRTFLSYLRKNLPTFKRLILMFELPFLQIFHRMLYLIKLYHRWTKTTLIRNCIWPFYLNFLPENYPVNITYNSYLIIITYTLRYSAVTWHPAELDIRNMLSWSMIKPGLTPARILI